jgi:hypothetical protein
MNLAQKILLYSLYGLVLLMIVFSFQASSNMGKVGYDSCIAKKCEISEEYCTKFREVNNCCLGAGGNMANGPNGAVCVF